MNRQEHINRLIGETLDSVEGIGRAQAKPFLLTRINARLNRTAESVWEQAVKIIARPAVALTGLCVIILINVMVVVFNGRSDAIVATDQLVQSPADEFSYTVATIYDIENTQP